MFLVNACGGVLHIGNGEFEEKIIIGPSAHLGAVVQPLFVLLYFLSYKSKSKIITYSVKALLGFGIFIYMKISVVMVNNDCYLFF